MHPLFGDAYTISSDFFISQKAKEKSVYSFVNRIPPIQSLPDCAKDSRMVLYGLSDFIKKHLCSPVTISDVRNAEEFMKSACCFGGPLPFPSELWYKVINKFGGYLPITIRGLAEGSTFFPNEPVIQVTSDVEGMGELAAYIEALLVGYVSIASARATIARHLLERCKDYLRSINFVGDIESRARFLIHDFGMRASSCSEESSILGRAHLLTFYGTDTFSAAYESRVMGAKNPTGSSVLALAHRIISGHESEEDAYKAIMEVARNHGNFVSCLTDCYNMEKARITLTRLAKENPDITISLRDDSGYYENNIHESIKICKGLPNMTTILGDSMNPTKINKVFEICRSHKFIPTFGVGGWLRNTATRDLFSSSYKLASVGKDNEPVIKIAEVEGKRSIPGPNKIRRSYLDGISVFMAYESIPDAMETHYTFYNSKLEAVQKYVEPYIKTESFDTLQQRCINDFNGFAEMAGKFPYYGGNRQQILSPETIKVSNSLYNRYR